MKYTNKLKNMSRALADMGTDVLPNVGCAFIGLSEVENANVLKDLTAQPPLKQETCSSAISRVPISEASIVRCSIIRHSSR